ncbi:hypothetical protein Sjap_019621 [Stephania japonica]|uniref:Uncharacterized protein n=1 Tax=Stephania japonica TaxID=461633 RepID=A0AAP0F1Z1_9MAGN
MSANYDDELRGSKNLNNMFWLGRRQSCRGLWRPRCHLRYPNQSSLASNLLAISRPVSDLLYSSLQWRSSLAADAPVSSPTSAFAAASRAVALRFRDLNRRSGVRISVQLVLRRRASRDLVRSGVVFSSPGLPIWRRKGESIGRGASFASLLNSVTSNTSKEKSSRLIHKADEKFPMDIDLIVAVNED